MFEWPSLTEQDALLHLGAKPELRVHTQEARMPRMEQRPQPPGDLLLVAPPHSQQAQGYGDNAHRDTDWPELVSLAEQARRLVRAIVVRVVADRAERAIRPLCRESGGGAA